MKRRFGSVVVVVVFFEQTEFAAAPFELLLDLLLHQVEAHGEQRQSERQPDGAEDELLGAGPLFQPGAGHDVAEPDRRQRDEAEVGPGQVVPLFPQREQHRPDENVGGNDQQTDRYRNSHVQLQNTTNLVCQLNPEYSSFPGTKALTSK